MTSTALLAAGLITLFSTSPQEPVEESIADNPLVGMGELVVEMYSPQHAYLYDLEELLGSMAGRELYVRERGGFESDPVFNVRTLGDSLLLYDVPTQLERMKSLLEVLDQPYEPKERPEKVEPGLETYEYEARYVPVHELYGALGGFQRLVVDEGNQVGNVTMADERNLLVFRDDAERIVKIKRLLEELDQPKDQIVITCHLIRAQQIKEANGEAIAGGAPEEVLVHLEKLLPGMHFEATGFSMLRMSVSPGKGVQLNLSEARPNANYSLEMRPTAYDRETSSLTLSDCSLMYSSGGLLFSTSAVLKGGEYTVLGATGSEPIFLVLRVQRAE